MHIGEMEIRIDPPQKRTPGSPRSRGSLQVVASACRLFCSGGGVSGDGGRPDGAFNKVLFHWRQPGSTPVNT